MNFYFLRFPETKLLFNIFSKNKIEARFVGGCVRDAILNEKTDDFDIAIKAQIELVIEIMKSENIHYIPTGLKYNSITVFINNIKFEITSLRKDIDCLGRACSQIPAMSFEEDAKRRDFTINALYLSQDGKLFDFFNGRKDLKNHDVKFIGDPKTRIAEDYLRILRYFRFCAKYGDFSNKYSDIIKNYSDKLSIISIERIQKELFKILHSKHFKTIINFMNDVSIFKNIPLKLDIDMLKKLPKNLSLELKLYLLFDYNDLLKVLHLRKSQKQKIKDFKIYEKESLLFCQYKKGTVFSQDVAIIKRYKLNETATISRKTFPKFPINFQDLEAGTQNASKKLKLCEKWWVENNFEKSKSECIDFVKNLGNF